MKLFLMTAGTVFGLIVIAHLARVHAESQMASDPFFWAITILAGALSSWAWWLVWKMRRP
jgi:hypothetical protein